VESTMESKTKCATVALTWLKVLNFAKFVAEQRRERPRPASKTSELQKTYLQVSLWN
jgi:hypothetical protein